MEKQIIKPASIKTEAGMYELREKTKIKFKHTNSDGHVCIRELHDLNHLYCSMCGTPIKFKETGIKF